MSRFTIGLGVVALLAGITALFFAACENPLGAIVGLALSVFWGLVSIGLLALGSSERRLRVEMEERVVERTLDYLLCEARRNSKQGDKADDWAGLVDRVNGLASKALQGASRNA